MKEHNFIPLHGYPCRHCGGVASKTALISVQQEAHPGICACDRGAILEKRYDAHPPSWLVVLAGQQKRSQKLGDFFAGKS